MAVAIGKSPNHTSTRQIVDGDCYSRCSSRAVLSDCHESSGENTSSFALRTLLWLDCWVRSRLELSNAVNQR